MIRLTPAIGVLSSVVIVGAMAAQASMAQAPAHKACGLVTESELQSALGSKVTLKAGSIGDVQTCGGVSQSTRVQLRLFKRSTDSSGNAEQAGIDAIARRQLLLPINDNYFCRRRVSKGAPLATAAELGN